MKNEANFKVMIVEDSEIDLKVIKSILSDELFNLVVCRDGTSVLPTLESDPTIEMVLLDWNLPGELQGIDLCRQIANNPQLNEKYIILSTSRNSSEDIIEGLNAGANDYICKPLDAGTFIARIRAGQRTLCFQNYLKSKIETLNSQLKSIEAFEDLIPICTWCQKIKSDEEYLKSVDKYFCSKTLNNYSPGACCCHGESKVS